MLWLLGFLFFGGDVVTGKAVGALSKRFPIVERILGWLAVTVLLLFGAAFIFGLYANLVGYDPIPTKPG
jgi:hypothetical protein